MKKAISFILIFAFVFGVLAPAAYAEEKSDYPVIMLEGRGAETPIYARGGYRYILLIPRRTI